MRGGREVAWYQTGKVPAVGVAPEESQVAWEAVLGEARTAGLIDPEGAPFVATDGNSGLLAAVAMELPWAVVQRCVWHIGYRTRGKIRNPAHRDALERDALWIFRAADVAAARRRLTSFMERRRELEPEAAASVGRKFPAGGWSICAIPSGRCVRAPLRSASATTRRPSGVSAPDGASGASATCRRWCGCRRHSTTALSTASTGWSMPRAALGPARRTDNCIPA